MANHEVIELDYDPLEFLDAEGLGTLVSPQGVAEAAKADDQEMAAALDVYEALDACINIVGPVKLCATKVGAAFKVCLKLAGLEVACANVGLSKCQTLQGNVLLAKASIKVCFEKKALTYQAQACYRATPFSSWNCVNKKGTIFSL